MLLFCGLSFLLFLSQNLIMVFFFFSNSLILFFNLSLFLSLFFSFYFHSFFSNFTLAFFSFLSLESLLLHFSSLWRFCDNHSFRHHWSQTRHTHSTHTWHFSSITLLYFFLFMWVWISQIWDYLNWFGLFLFFFINLNVCYDKNLSFCFILYIVEIIDFIFRFILFPSQSKSITLRLLFDLFIIFFDLWNCWYFAFFYFFFSFFDKFFFNDN